MNDELTQDEIYASYFDANGQPVRVGAQLTADEQATYDLYFNETTEGTHQ
ncbi:hypothetical protein SAMN05661080_05140 [Modestobacter sp. DSM 44400]|nr:hypothetical protein [Modestobacter sp. DSM 44400]SDY96030.1 hypothetical protein SAMN05661080_05140 [Modestobacter sp. DSM 44400]